ncbi:DUF3344 domain-containing protein, partial [Methanobrevibacter sp.]|uniref:DUF3344 domain-containing protein n=1 Tax=Methanobrevibacter sp. TaxID=66852 RepID=UPI00386FFD77
MDIAEDHSFDTESSFSYDVPSNATIKKAYLHANVYSGSAQPTYGANAQIYMNGNLFKSENLVCTQGSTDGTVYTINANITKVYSDYDMRYDITDTISGLNGTTLNFEIETSRINGYSFDGRIKWFALVVAYDDGDDDVIYYWIKSGQAWFNQPATTTFETASISNPKNANLRNVILSSSNPAFTINGCSTIANNTASGGYYKCNEWYDISNYMPGSSNTVLGWVPGSGYYGFSMKTVLGVLTLEEEQIPAKQCNDLLGSVDLSEVLSVSSEENLADVHELTSGIYDWSYNTTVNGYIDIFIYNDYQGSGEVNHTNITINLNEDEKITESYLFIPIRNHQSKTIEDLLKVIQFNGHNITDNLMDVYAFKDGNNFYSLFIVNITGLIKANEGNYLYMNLPSRVASFNEYIITLIQKPGEPQKNVYFGNGQSDLKTNGPKVENEVNVTLDNIIDATYYLFGSIRIQCNVPTVEFNNNTFNPFPGASTITNTVCFSTDVTEIIKESNNITLKAIDIGQSQDYYSNLLTQLIVTTVGELDVEVTNIATEYTNTAYAGTNNVITATVDSTIPIGSNNNFTVKLLADGQIVNESAVDLTKGISTIVLTDPTIRPVDEFTVYAADVTNKKVVYTVEIYDGDKLISTKNITVPIRYNGYLSKDYAYPTGDEPYTLNTTVSGGVLVDITESGYISTGINNRTDNFTLTLPGNSTFVNGLLYVPYTSDFTPAGYPVFTMTFNGADISDKILGKYRDKTNLGTSDYGKKYYGVLIYDVSGLIKDGNNTLVLIKANGTNVAVYPTILIGLYNTTNSTVLSDIYILNGADQLTKSSYNKAGRLVNVTNKVDLDAGKMQNAYWYVFESGGTSGRGDLVFNDKLYSNVWNGTDYNLVQYYVADVSDLIKDSNIVSFVATGSGITALQQIFVVETALFNLNLPAEITTGETSSFTMDLPSDAKGYVLLEVDGNKLFSEVTNGTATFNIPSLTAGDNIVKCTYLGDDKYKAMTVNSIIHVLAKPVLTAKDVTMLYTSNQYYSVKVTQDGKALTGKAVTFTVNGKAITANTDKNGVAKVKLSLNPGKYTVSASYGGIKVTNNVKVNSIIKASNKKVKKSAKKLKIKVSLKKVDGKFLKGKTLKLKINGKTLKAKTNKKGAATFTIKKNILKKLKAGKKYTYKVTYSKDT